jgi:pyrroline-5-carboxylate reductase
MHMAKAGRILAILGAGNMAECILSCALNNKVVAAGQVRAADPVAERRQLFANQFGVQVTSDNAEAAQGADVVLLSIKPQTFHTEATALARAVGKDCSIISIMAGIPTAAIERALGGTARVVRAMPNLPIRVAAGVAGVCRGRYATDQDLAFAMELFEAGGKAIALRDEDLMDAVTAVSGSGPAYFYYFVEAMAEAGAELGLSRDEALTLAEHTCLGAARMMVQTGEDPAALRQKVSSKGGTTLAALEVMAAGDVKGKIKAAVLRAYQRARELAKG